MTVKVVFECDGCETTVKGTEPIKRFFESFNVKGYGFGTYHTLTIEDVLPKGWIDFDPYTSCTYCPNCWEEITKEEATA